MLELQMTIGIHIPPGRPAGVPNKATSNAREAIARFVDENAPRLNKWLDQIAEENPKAAFDAFMSVVEYHIPKLSRADNTNTNVGIVQIVLESAKHAALAKAIVSGSGVVVDGEAVSVDSVSAGSPSHELNNHSMITVSNTIETTAKQTLHPSRNESIGVAGGGVCPNRRKG